MITIRKPSGENIILGYDGEEAIESALKFYIFNSDSGEKALNVLEHLDPQWVFTWKKEVKQ